MTHSIALAGTVHRMADITRILSQIESGDRHAADELLLPHLSSVFLLGRISEVLTNWIFPGKGSGFGPELHF